MLFSLNTSHFLYVFFFLSNRLFKLVKIYTLKPNILILIQYRESKNVNNKYLTFLWGLKDFSREKPYIEFLHFYIILQIMSLLLKLYKNGRFFSKLILKYILGLYVFIYIFKHKKRDTLVLNELFSSLKIQLISS